MILLQLNTHLNLIHHGGREFQGTPFWFCKLLLHNTIHAIRTQLARQGHENFLVYVVQALGEFGEY